MFLPGKSRGQKGLAGSNPWGRKESAQDTAEQAQLSDNPKDSVSSALFHLHPNTTLCWKESVHEEKQFWRSMLLCRIFLGGTHLNLYSLRQKHWFSNACLPSCEIYRLGKRPERNITIIMLDGGIIVGDFLLPFPTTFCSVFSL